MDCSQSRPGVWSFRRVLAGTIQEVFQDATQNHYDVFGVVSPMVFLDKEFWTETLPAEPLLRKLAGERTYGTMIGSVDTADEIVSSVQVVGARPVAVAACGTEHLFGLGFGR
jgi:hypothetical protein